MIRRCALGADCDSFQSATNTAGDPWGFNLCDTCNSHFTNDVAALLYAYVDLSQAIARRDSHSESKISRPKPASAPPIDLHIFTLRSAIADALLDAEAALRAAATGALRDPSNAREGFNVQVAVDYVRPRVDGLAALPAGAEHLLRLRSARRAADQALSRPELVISLPGFCPKCHVQNVLTRRDGSESVVCGSCRHAMHWPDYQKLVTLVVTEIPSSTRNQAS